MQPTETTSWDATTAEVAARLEGADDRDEVLDLLVDVEEGLDALDRRFVIKDTASRLKAIVQNVPDLETACIIMDQLAEGHRPGSD